MLAIPKLAALAQSLVTPLNNAIGEVPPIVPPPVETKYKLKFNGASYADFHAMTLLAEHEVEIGFIGPSATFTILLTSTDGNMRYRLASTGGMQYRDLAHGVTLDGQLSINDGQEYRSQINHLADRVQILRDGALDVEALGALHTTVLARISGRAPANNMLTGWITYLRVSGIGNSPYDSGEAEWLMDTNPEDDNWTYTDTKNGVVMTVHNAVSADVTER